MGRKNPVREKHNSEFQAYRFPENMIPEFMNPGIINYPGSAGSHKAKGMDSNEMSASDAEHSLRIPFFPLINFQPNLLSQYGVTPADASSEEETGRTPRDQAEIGTKNQ